MIKGDERGVGASQGCSDARRFAKVLGIRSIIVSEAALGGPATDEANLRTTEVRHQAAIHLLPGTSLPSRTQLTAEPEAPAFTAQQQIHMKVEHYLAPMLADLGHAAVKVVVQLVLSIILIVATVYPDISGATIVRIPVGGCGLAVAVYFAAELLARDTATANYALALNKSALKALRDTW
ncbi:hypothetical protein [Paraburkholderia flagellata]|uniref:hypothetical protein n=1 Tax=Paraburkholderia flagellata TaxID=2883241 RepID=UPI001F317AFC|nr:hypothetical protein [Paraburkholderia flagellata]